MKPSTDPVGEILFRLLADVDDQMRLVGNTWKSKNQAADKISKDAAKAKQALNAYYLSLLPEKYVIDPDYLIGGETPETTRMSGWNAAIEETRKRFKGAASPQEDNDD